VTAPTAVVTGVGRRRGIGAAVSRVLVREGWRVVAWGWPEYDRNAPRAHAEADSLDELLAELEPTGRFQWHEIDLATLGAPRSVVETAAPVDGCVQALVAAHAESLGGGILEVTADEFDRHVAVNARTTLLLIGEFARRWRGDPGSGRIVTFVSGPPLVGEIAYAASKGAIEWLTVSAAAELAGRE